MMMPASGWSIKQATEEIRALAKSDRLDLSYKLHAKDRLSERGLIVSDVLHALKYGFVYQAPIPATRAGYFRYWMECMTPNSGAGTLAVVVIPDKRGCVLKVVTVMWLDEASTIAGSIVGEGI